VALLRNFDLNADETPHQLTIPPTASLKTKLNLPVSNLDLSDPAGQSYPAFLDLGEYPKNSAPQRHRTS